MANDEYVSGFQYETSYAEAYVPSAAHTFYKLGEELGTYSVVWAKQEVIQQFSAATNYPTLSGGRLLSLGATRFKVVNGIPAFLLLGLSATASDVHTITPLAAGDDLQSIRCHNEERGGTEDSLRDTLGCVAGNGVLSWDVATAELQGQLSFLGSTERDAEDGSNPAVQLTNAPVLPTGSNDEPFTFHSSSAFSRWDVDGTPETFDMLRWDMKWDNMLLDPTYTFSGGAWPVAIRKRRPGVGHLTVHYTHDTRWGHHAVLAQQDKTMDFKFVKGSDPTNVYFTVELEHCFVEQVTVDHILEGIDNKAVARAEIAFSYPEIKTKDGITDEATWYGE